MDMVHMDDKAGAFFVVACFVLVILIIIFGSYVIPNWDQLIAG